MEAEQRVLQSKNELVRIEIEARQAEAAAIGEAAAIRAKAKAEADADAIELRGAALLRNSNVIAWEKAQL